MVSGGLRASLMLKLVGTGLISSSARAFLGANKPDGKKRIDKSEMIAAVIPKMINWSQNSLLIMTADDF